MSTCWCCGDDFPEERLLRLGSHPEVAVCLRCSVRLVRQARAKHEALHPSLTARLHEVVAGARQTVVRLGLDRLPVVGPGFRWLGDHLP